MWYDDYKTLNEFIDELKDIANTYGEEKISVGLSGCPAEFFISILSKNKQIYIDMCKH